MVVSFGIGPVWASWSVSSVPGGYGTSAASTVSAGQTPAATASGPTSITVSWPASTLSGGQAVTGYTVKRFNSTTLVEQSALGGCSGTVTETTCIETSVPSGSWTYSVIPRVATDWTGAESPKSATVSTDSISPSNDVSISGSNSWLGANSVYYRGSVAGTLTVTNAVTDAGSGPASSTSSLGGLATGWTHVGSTVSIPAGGPFVSNSFTWSVGTTSNPSISIAGRDVAGNAVVSLLPLVPDSTAPTVGTVTYGTESTSTSVPISFTTGTDDGSGISDRLLQRASAPLTESTCGTFGSFTTVTNGTNPTSPFTDRTVRGTCYKYQYVTSDRVGNTGTPATNSNVVKVASSATSRISWSTSSSCVDRDEATSNVQIWTCNSSPQQTWTSNANGSLTVFGLCLQIPAGQTANNTLVSTGACTGAPSQVWAQVDGALLNQASGRCLDLDFGDSTDGRQLQVFDCVGGPGQTWIGPG
ncbi:ricin-type beta-trefoil lectin domain protein [Cryobacterium sp. N22]|uniref:ricin-type beta-trefoil lectin domain protein n=1 Tax=Cryobacterium sp. N22 TaxID=2048290 RepID=UPI00351535D2